MKKKRVENKYMSMEYFRKLHTGKTYEQSLEDVRKYMDNTIKRIPVLGVTEYLGPFVSNSILHSNNYQTPTPFIVYAPLIWSDADNIHVVRCFATGLKNKIYDKLIILLPLRKEQLFNKDGPRITVFEIYQMFKILGNFKVNVETDEEKNILTVLANQFSGGKKLFRRRKSHKNIKKRKTGKKHRQTRRRG